MGEILLLEQIQQKSIGMINRMGELATYFGENVSRKVVALTTVGALALTGCASTRTEAIEPGADPTTVTVTQDPTTAPTTETPSPSETTDMTETAIPIETPDATSADPETSSQAAYEVPPKYAKAKKLSDEAFNKTSPSTKMQFLQGITHDLLEGDSKDAELVQEIREKLESGIVPWMSTKQDDPQSIMDKISTLERIGKALIDSGDVESGRKVYGMLDMRKGGLFEFAGNADLYYDHSEDATKKSEKHIVHPALILFDAYYGTPDVYDYEYEYSKDTLVRCVDYDPSKNPEGSLYVLARAYDSKGGEDLMVFYLYAPEEGIDRVYYNPAGALPDGKFSVWSYVGSNDKLEGIGSFRDDEFMKNYIPPEFTIGSTAYSETGGVTCDLEGIKWWWEL